MTPSSQELESPGNPGRFKPILNEDGAVKNDCERNAAKRLCQALHERYPDLKLILVEDALFANAPHVRQINAYGWLYVLNVKLESHASLERQFAGRKDRGQVKELRQTDSQGIRHYFAWTNDLCLCESATDVSVNYLLYEQTDKRGKVTRWTWVTNIRLNARSVESVMRAAECSMKGMSREKSPPNLAARIFLTASPAILVATDTVAGRALCQLS